MESIPNLFSGAKGPRPGQTSGVSKALGGWLFFCFKLFLGFLQLMFVGFLKGFKFCFVLLGFS